VNDLERKMLLLLRKLKDEVGVISVKAEFEAEGTRIDELYRLIDISRKADLKIALKIGGCEAIKDLMESKQIGVDYVIAPMIESAYALSKFIDAKNKVYNQNEQEDTDFLFNIETITGFQNLEDIINCASNNLNGLVFGRVDFSLSLGLSRNDIAQEVVTDYVKAVASKTKQANLDFIVGGAVSIDTLQSLKEIYAINLDRFETRKIIFDANALTRKEVEQSLIDAVHFEILWLINKREYYSSITNEDNSRIAYLEKRWSILGQ
jgi:hypothetical protein